MSETAVRSHLLPLDSQQDTVFFTTPTVSAPIEEHGDLLEFCFNVITKDPNTWQEALRRPHLEAIEWQKAIDAELKQLKDMDVYERVRLPDGRKAIKSRMLFKTKYTQDLCILKRKCRLVCQGFSSTPHEDYDPNNLFSPVSGAVQIRMLMALSVGLSIRSVRSFDISGAFLSAKVQEDKEVYVKPPPCAQEEPGIVWRLKRQLYGLKDSPFRFHEDFANWLVDYGFEPVNEDQTVFVLNRGRIGRGGVSSDSEGNPSNSGLNNGRLLLSIYVDDGLCLCEDDETYEQFLSDLRRRYDLTDNGSALYHLGMNLEFDSLAKRMKIHQGTYVTKMLQRFGFDHDYDGQGNAYRHVSTPIEAALSKADCPAQPDPAFQKLYMEKVGSLMHLHWCRPELAYALSEVSKFMSNAGQVHMNAVDRIFRYLRDHVSDGLTFSGNPSNPKMLNRCVAFADASWAEQPDERRSTFGFCFMMNGSCVAFKSKRINSICTSTCDAEYIAAARCIAQALAMRYFLVRLSQLWGDREFFRTQIDPMYVMEDNQSTIAILHNPVHSEATKHIDLAYSFARHHVRAGRFRIKYLESADMISDLMTKAVNSAIASRLRSFILGPLDLDIFLDAPS